MSMTDFATDLRQKIAEKRKSNHSQMDKGVGNDEYNKLVGRNAQLTEVSGWITEVMKHIDSEDGEHEL